MDDTFFEFLEVGDFCQQSPADTADISRVCADNSVSRNGGAVKNNGSTTCNSCARLSKEIQELNVKLRMLPILKKKLVSTDHVVSRCRALEEQYRQQTLRLESSSRLVDSLNRDCAQYENKMRDTLQQHNDAQQLLKDRDKEIRDLRDKCESMSQEVAGAEALQIQYQASMKNLTEQIKVSSDELSTTRENLKRVTSESRSEIVRLKRICRLMSRAVTGVITTYEMRSLKLFASRVDVPLLTEAVQRLKDSSSTAIESRSTDKQSSSATSPPHESRVDCSSVVSPGVEDNQSSLTCTPTSSIGKSSSDVAIPEQPSHIHLPVCNSTVPLNSTRQRHESLSASSSSSSDEEADILTQNGSRDEADGGKDVLNFTNSDSESDPNRPSSDDFSVRVGKPSTHGDTVSGETAVPPGGSTSVPTSMSDSEVQVPCCRSLSETERLDFSAEFNGVTTMAHSIVANNNNNNYTNNSQNVRRSDKVSFCGVFDSSDCLRVNVCSDVESVGVDQADISDDEIDVVNGHADIADVSDRHEDSTDLPDLQVNTADVSDHHEDTTDVPDHHKDTANVSERHEDTADLRDLQANTADPPDLQANTADLLDLQANTADLSDLQVDTVNVSDHHEDTADVSDLQANTADFPDLQAYTADLTGLQVNTVNVSDRHRDTADVSDQHRNTADVSDHHRNTADVSGHHRDTADVSDRHRDTADVSGHHRITADVSNRHRDTADVCDHHRDTADVSNRHGATADVCDHHRDTADVFDRHGDTADVSDHHGDTADVSDHHRDTVKVSDHLRDTTDVSDHHRDTAKVPDHHGDTADVFDHHGDTADVSDQHRDTAKVSDHHRDTAGVSHLQANISHLSDHHEDTAKVSDHQTSITDVSDPRTKFADASCDQVNDHTTVSHSTGPTNPTGHCHRKTSDMWFKLLSASAATCRSVENIIATMVMPGLLPYEPLSPLPSTDTPSDLPSSTLSPTSSQSSQPLLIRSCSSVVITSSPCVRVTSSHAISSVQSSSSMSPLFPRIDSKTVCISTSSTTTSPSGADSIESSLDSSLCVRRCLPPPPNHAVSSIVTTHRTGSVVSSLQSMDSCMFVDTTVVGLTHNTTTTTTTHSTISCGNIVNAPPRVSLTAALGHVRSFGDSSSSTFSHLIASSQQRNITDDHNTFDSESIVLSAITETVGERSINAIADADCIAVRVGDASTSVLNQNSFPDCITTSTLISVSSRCADVSAPAITVSSRCADISAPAITVSSRCADVSATAITVSSRCADVSAPAITVSSISSRCADVSAPAITVNSRCADVSAPAITVSSRCADVSAPAITVSSRCADVSAPAITVSSRCADVSAPAITVSSISSRCADVSAPAITVSSRCADVSDPAITVSSRCADVSAPAITVSSRCADVSAPAITVSSRCADVSAPAITVSSRCADVSAPAITVSSRCADASAPAITVSSRCADVSAPAITVSSISSRCADVSVPAITVNSISSRCADVSPPAITVNSISNRCADVSVPAITVSSRCADVSVPAITVSSISSRCADVSAPVITVSSICADVSVPAITVSSISSRFADVSVPAITVSSISSRCADVSPRPPPISAVSAVPVTRRRSSTCCFDWSRRRRLFAFGQKSRDRVRFTRRGCLRCAFIRRTPLPLVYNFSQLEPKDRRTCLDWERAWLFRANFVWRRECCATQRSKTVTSTASSSPIVSTPRAEVRCYKTARSLSLQSSISAFSPISGSSVGSRSSTSAVVADNYGAADNIIYRTVTAANNTQSRVITSPIGSNHRFTPSTMNEQLYDVSDFPLRESPSTRHSSLIQPTVLTVNQQPVSSDELDMSSSPSVYTPINKCGPGDEEDRSSFTNRTFTDTVASSTSSVSLSDSTYLCTVTNKDSIPTADILHCSSNVTTLFSKLTEQACPKSTAGEVISGVSSSVNTALSSSDTQTSVDVLCSSENGASFNENGVSSIGINVSPNDNDETSNVCSLKRKRSDISIGDFRNHQPPFHCVINTDDNPGIVASDTSSSSAITSYTTAGVSVNNSCGSPNHSYMLNGPVSALPLHTSQSVGVGDGGNDIGGGSDGNNNLVVPSQSRNEAAADTVLHFPNSVTSASVAFEERCHKRDGTAGSIVGSVSDSTGNGPDSLDSDADSSSRDSGVFRTTVSIKDVVDGGDQGITPADDRGPTSDGDHGPTPDGGHGPTPDGDHGAFPDGDHSPLSDGDYGSTPDVDGATPDGDDHGPTSDGDHGVKPYDDNDYGVTPGGDHDVASDSDGDHGATPDGDGDHGVTSDADGDRGETPVMDVETFDDIVDTIVCSTDKIETESSIHVSTSNVASVASEIFTYSPAHSTKSTVSSDTDLITSSLDCEGVEKVEENLDIPLKKPRRSRVQSSPNQDNKRACSMRRNGAVKTSPADLSTTGAEDCIVVQTAKSQDLESSVRVLRRKTVDVSSPVLGPELRSGSSIPSRGLEESPGRTAAARASTSTSVRKLRPRGLRRDSSTESPVKNSGMCTRKRRRQQSEISSDSTNVVTRRRQSRLDGNTCDAGDRSSIKNSSPRLNGKSRKSRRLVDDASEDEVEAEQNASDSVLSSKSCSVKLFRSSLGSIAQSSNDGITKVSNEQRRSVEGNRFDEHKLTGRNGHSDIPVVSEQITNVSPCDFQKGSVTSNTCSQAAEQAKSILVIEEDQTFQQSDTSDAELEIVTECVPEETCTSGLILDDRASSVEKGSSTSSATSTTGSLSNQRAVSGFSESSSSASSMATVGNGTVPVKSASSSHLSVSGLASLLTGPNMGRTSRSTPVRPRRFLTIASTPQRAPLAEAVCNVSADSSDDEDELTSMVIDEKASGASSISMVQGASDQPDQPRVPISTTASSSTVKPSLTTPSIDIDRISSSPNQSQHHSVVNNGFSLGSKHKIDSTTGTDDSVSESSCAAVVARERTVPVNTAPSCNGEATGESEGIIPSHGTTEKTSTNILRPGVRVAFPTVIRPVLTRKVASTQLKRPCGFKRRSSPEPSPVKKLCSRHVSVDGSDVEVADTILEQPVVNSTSSDLDSMENESSAGATLVDEPISAASNSASSESNMQPMVTPTRRSLGSSSHRTISTSSSLCLNGTNIYKQVPCVSRDNHSSSVSTSNSLSARPISSASPTSVFAGRKSATSANRLRAIVNRFRSPSSRVATASPAAVRGPDSLASTKTPNTPSSTTTSTNHTSFANTSLPHLSEDVDDFDGGGSRKELSRVYSDKHRPSTSSHPRSVSNNTKNKICDRSTSRNETSTDDNQQQNKRRSSTETRVAVGASRGNESGERRRSSTSSSSSAAAKTSVSCSALPSFYDLLPPTTTTSPTPRTNGSASCSVSSSAAVVSTATPGGSCAKLMVADNQTAAGGCENDDSASVASSSDNASSVKIDFRNIRSAVAEILCLDADSVLYAHAVRSLFVTTADSLSTGKVTTRTRRRALLLLVSHLCHQVALTVCGDIDECRTTPPPAITRPVALAHRLCSASRVRVIEGILQLLTHIRRQLQLSWKDRLGLAGGGGGPEGAIRWPRQCRLQLMRFAAALGRSVGALAAVRCLMVDAVLVCASSVDAVAVTLAMCQVWDKVLKERTDAELSPIEHAFLYWTRFLHLCINNSTNVASKQSKRTSAEEAVLILSRCRHTRQLVTILQRTYNKQLRPLLASSETTLSSVDDQLCTRLVDGLISAEAAAKGGGGGQWRVALLLMWRLMGAEWCGTRVLDASVVPRVSAWRRSKHPQHQETGGSKSAAVVVCDDRAMIVCVRLVVHFILVSAGTLVWSGETSKSQTDNSQCSDASLELAMCVLESATDAVVEVCPSSGCSAGDAAPARGETVDGALAGSLHLLSDRVPSHCVDTRRRVALCLAKLQKPPK